MLANEQPGPPTRGRHANPVFRRLRPNAAVIVLGLVCALALVEILASALSYRERVSTEDWAQIEALLAAEQPDGETAPLIVASEWLGPAARMHLPAARSWEAVAYPDLRYPSFWVLSPMLERPWSGPLRAELEELEPPQPDRVHRVGGLSLRRYTHAGAVGTQTFNLLDSIERVSTERGACKAGRGQWTCKQGRVELTTIEVDYRPRRCLALELDDGVTARLELGEVELGESLRGHVGFGDFNARLRADPTARIELLVDGEVHGRWLFSDDQGWAAFALRTESGMHEVELRASSSVAGTWQRDGHRPTPTDTLCVEMRGFGPASSQTREGS